MSATNINNVGVSSTASVATPASVSNDQTENLQALAGASAEAVHGVLGGTGVSPDILLMLLSRRLNDVDGQIKSLMHLIETRTNQARGLQEKLAAMQDIAAAMAAKSTKSGAKFALKDLELGDGQTAYDVAVKYGLEEYLSLSNTEVGHTTAVEEARRIAEANGGALTEAQWDAYIAELEDKLPGWEKGADKHGRPKRRKRNERRRDHAYKVIGLKPDFSNGPIKVGDLEEAFKNPGITRNAKINRTALDKDIEALNSKLRKINSGNELDMIQLQSVMQQRSQSITLATNMLRNVNEATNKIIDNTR